MAIDFLLNPNVYILISSRSLCNLINVTINPKINTKGIITVIKLGIRNIDKYRITNMSAASKLVKDNNLVNCNNQAIDKKIKKIKKKSL